MTLRELLEIQNEFNEAIYNLVTKNGLNGTEDFAERSEKLEALRSRAQRKKWTFQEASRQFLETCHEVLDGIRRAFL